MLSRSSRTSSPLTRSREEWDPESGRSHSWLAYARVRVSGSVDQFRRRLSMRLMLMALRGLVPALTADDQIPLSEPSVRPEVREKRAPV